MSIMAAKKKPAPPTTPAETLSLSSRCDRCNGQAYVHVTLLTGDLQFCGHHFASYEVALTPVVITVDDQRSKISA